MVKEAIQYAAYIEHVREVALFGTADMGFWREALGREGLFAYEVDGRAGILISAPRLLWKGARFCECAVSVAVSGREDGGSHDGYFLAHAFNSNRFFAFSERLFFRTPYYFAEVAVSEKVPASMRVGAQTIFEARMNVGEHAPARVAEEYFQGRVYLPGGRDYFVARISGETAFYPFATEDTLVMTGDGIFGQLRESQFAGVEWRIREDAIHGKSKTYRRA